LIWRVSVRSSIPTISYRPDNSTRRSTSDEYGSHHPNYAARCKMGERHRLPSDCARAQKSRAGDRQACGLTTPLTLNQGGRRSGQTNVPKPLDTTEEYAAANIGSHSPSFCSTGTYRRRTEISIQFCDLSRGYLISARCITIRSHIAPRWHTREAADPAPFVTKQMRR
jgi:hypothetical protein